MHIIIVQAVFFYLPIYSDKENNPEFKTTSLKTSVKQTFYLQKVEAPKAVFPLRPYVAKLAQHFEKLAQQNVRMSKKKRCFFLII